MSKIERKKREIFEFIDRCYSEGSIKDELTEEKEKLDKILIEMDTKIFNNKEVNESLREDFLKLETKIDEYVEKVKEKYFKYGTIIN